MPRNVVRMVDNWLCVPYDGHDLARVEIEFRQGDDVIVKPAFLDYVENVRVAKVRVMDLSHGRAAVALLKNGERTNMGTIDL